MRIGIDLGGTKIEAIALGDEGEELLRRRVATPAGDYLGTVAAVAELVRGVEETLGSTGTVGVGIPGALSPATGRVKNANSVCLIGEPLDRDLEAALERPIRLANDANCFVVSEATDGAAAGAETVFGVILGTGVGGGIALRGRPLTGRHAIAGEWGHSPLPWPEGDERPGPACYCGRHGCLETFLSGPGLSADHARLSGRDLGPAEIIDLAEDGDSLAERSLQCYEDRLARGLATVINLLDPDRIVLGGGLSNMQRLYDSVPALWLDYVFSDTCTTPLLPPRHGDSSGVRGAAWLWPPKAAWRDVGDAMSVTRQP
ncbi:MAG: ROK family protein [Acidobacteriota bacterium]